MHYFEHIATLLQIPVPKPDRHSVITSCSTESKCWRILSGRITDRKTAKAHLYTLISNFDALSAKEPSPAYAMLPSISKSTNLVDSCRYASAAAESACLAAKLLEILEKCPSSIFFIDSTGALPIEVLSNVALNQHLYIPFFTLVPAYNQNNDTLFYYLELNNEPVLSNNSDHINTFASDFDFWKFVKDYYLEQERLESVKKGKLLDDFKPLTKYLGNSQDRENCNDTFQNERKRAFEDYSRNKVVSVHGTIKAKSAIVKSNNSQIHFIIQLSCPSGFSNSHTCFILYNSTIHDPNIKMDYDNFRIGNSFLLSNLRPTKMRIEQGSSGGKSRKILQFMNGDSKVFELDEKQYKLPIWLYPNQREAPPNQENFSHENDQDVFSQQTAIIKKLHTSTKVVSYIGIITSTTSHKMGIYTLDSDVVLYWTFCEDNHMLGIRVGCRVEVSNVHVLLNNEKINLIGCDYSSFRIREFSPEKNQGCFVYSRVQKQALIKNLDGFNGVDLVIFEELKREIAIKKIINFNDEALKEILSWFGYTPIHILDSNMYKNFLDHDNNCRNSQIRYTPLSLPSIKQVIESVGLIEKLKMMVGDCNIESNKMLSLKFGWDGVDSCVFGKFSIDAWGRYLCSDVTGQLRIFVFEDAGTDHHGTILPYHLEKYIGITKCEFFIEWLGYSSVVPNEESQQLEEWKKFMLNDGCEELRKQNIFKMYILVNFKDIKFFDFTKTQSSMNDKPEYFLLFHILEISPTRIQYTSQNQPYAQTYANGISWSIKKSKNQLSILSNGRYTLSRSRLPLLFKVGCNYLLSNVVFDFGDEILHADEFDVKRKISDETSFSISAESIIIPFEFQNEPKPSPGIVNGVLATAFDKTLYENGIRRKSINPIRQIRDILETPFENERIISLHGFLSFKEFRSIDYKQSNSTHDPEDLFNLLDIGTGKNGRLIFLRLRDPEDIKKTLMGANVAMRWIDVYVDIRAYSFPAALLPGSLINIRNILLKASGNGKVYCQFLSCSSIEVREGSYVSKLSSSVDKLGMIEQENIYVRPLKTLPQRNTLNEMFFKPINGEWCTEFLVNSTIKVIKEVKLWITCSLCCVQLIESRCPNDCHIDKYKTILNGRIQFFVEDGTGEAILKSEDLNIIKSLLIGFNQHDAFWESKWRNLIDVLNMVGFVNVVLDFSSGYEEEEEEHENTEFKHERSLESQVHREVEDSQYDLLRFLMKKSPMLNETILTLVKKPSWRTPKNHNNKAEPVNSSDSIFSFPISSLRVKSIKNFNTMTTNMTSMGFPRMVTECLQIEKIDYNHETKKLLEIIKT